MRSCFVARAAVVVAAISLVILAGCGAGATTKHFVDTETPSGDLRAVQISPAPGTAYISRRTVFRLTWPQGNPPPTFEVELQRYKEAHECNDEADEATDQDQERYGVGSRITRQGDALIFDLEPNDDLDPGGIYFLHLRSAPDEFRVVYMAANDRSTPPTAEPLAPEGSYRHTVRVR